MRTILLFIVLGISTIAFEAKTIRVPDQYQKIQDAINAASDGDTVLVSPGLYRENLNFRGKNIVLTSRYFIDNNPGIIASTIIDGSSPRHPDTASCVIFISGEDSTAVLQGFTITGGKGTVWTDEHGAGVYREGGGILIALSDPVIKHNIIRDNEAVNKSGLQSAGGGGIRLGDARPSIIANLIIRNKGLYGGGIVMNYASAYVKNNIIYQNSGGQDFGGGGVWINNKLNSTTFNLLENNTIAGNYSEADGGGVLIWETKALLLNNIVWSNLAYTIGSNMRFRSHGSADMRYNNIQGGAAGEGNISVDPGFEENNKLLLSASSPCVDAGMESTIYNDPSDPENPSAASAPSRGQLRNDMGAYGGPLRYPEFIPFSSLKLIFPVDPLSYRKVPAGDSVILKLPVQNLSDVAGLIDSVFCRTTHFTYRLKDQLPFTVNSFRHDTLKISITPALKGSFRDTLYVYHNDTTIVSPQLIIISGTVVTDIPGEPTKALGYNLDQNFPNPFNPVTTIKFSIPNGGLVNLSVFNLLGQEVRTLISKFLAPGEHIASWNGKDNYGRPLSSGLYIYRLIAGSFNVSRQMMLIK